ncbi:MAG: hypothetical protein WKG07_38355 [Hymenobacter sp.]
MLDRTTVERNLALSGRAHGDRDDNGRISSKRSSTSRRATLRIAPEIGWGRVLLLGAGCVVPHHDGRTPPTISGPARREVADPV